MANVIDIRNFRKSADDPVEPKPDWMFNISVYAVEGGNEGTITEFNDGDGLEAADRLRAYAAALDHLSWLLRQQAERLGASADGECLATVHIFESSRVRLKVNDAKVETDEQRTWLGKRLDEAKEIIPLRP